MSILGGLLSASVRWPSSLSLSRTYAPFTAASSCPLNLAISMENDVRYMSSGTIFITFANAWESVTTRDTFPSSRLRVSSSSVSLHTTAVAPVSRTSLMTCCCGSISLPFGAAESIGMTSTTISPGCIKSPTSLLVMVSVTVSFPINSFSSSIPCLRSALTHMEFSAEF